MKHLNRRLMYFAMPHEIVERLSVLEAISPLSYVLAAETRESQAGKVWHAASEINSLGNIEEDQAIFGKRFLIGCGRERWKIRQVRQVAGGYSEFVDQSANPESVYFLPGGLHISSVAVIVGEFAIQGSDRYPLELLEKISCELSEWQEYKGYRISPLIWNREDQRLRLVTTSVRYGRACDLVIE